MENTQPVYIGQFTVEERKRMTAQMLQELRRARKLSQKEVAAHLNIPATTYNTYESGRTEPPAEILVRLSYLYETSVDVIVQRNRVHRTVEDMAQQVANMQQQLAEMDKQIEEHPDVPPIILAMRDSLKLILSGMEDMSQQPETRQALEETLQD